ncbi:MAG: tetratricopeptide repeat protein, partial [Blastocatellia bacterium]
TGYRPTEVAVDARRGEFNKQITVQMLPENTASQPSGGVISTKSLAIPKAAAEAVKKGLQALNEKKDARQSIEHFQEAIKLHPEYPEAYFLIGTAHMQQKTFDQAQNAFEKSIKLDADFAMPYYPLAVLLAGQKRYEESDQLLLRAIELEPLSWQGPFELGRSYANRQVWDKAITYSEMACAKQNPASKVHLLMADVYSNTGRVEKAVNELELFIKLDPKSPYLPRVKESLVQLKQQK